MAKMNVVRKFRQELSMRVLPTLLLPFLCSNVFSQVDNCELKKDMDGILVYTCESESERFKSLKATFTISNTTVEELGAFLKQVDHYTKWQYNMISAQLLKRVSDDTLIVRTEIEAPWPVDNRELIVEYSFLQNQQDKKLKVVTKTIPYDYPLSDDVVRIPFSHAEWDVTTVDDTLHVIYTMKIDPGGALPAWLVNMTMADGPHHSFSKLKELLK